jgi:hypothetical protein
MVQLHSQTGESPPSDTYPLLDTETYQIFREYLQHEDELANNRLSWMLTIHGFLYASYAFTVQTKLVVAQRINSDLLAQLPRADSVGHAGSYPASFLLGRRPSKHPKGIFVCEVDPSIFNVRMGIQLAFRRMADLVCSYVKTDSAPRQKLPMCATAA